MELKRFSRNDDERKKKSQAFKDVVSLEDDEDELKSLDDLEEEDDLTLLSKKY